MKNKLFPILSLFGILAAVTVIFWGPQYYKDFRSDKTDSKLPDIQRTTLDDFRNKNRGKSCEGKSLCFNTWTLSKLPDGDIIFGMITPSDFGRIESEEGGLALGSAAGTRYDIVLIKDRSKSCKEIANYLQASSESPWEEIKMDSGLQNDGSFYEQRIYSDFRQDLKKNITTVVHCQRYRDATLSVVAWVSPSDTELTPETVPELLKTSARVVRLK